MNVFSFHHAGGSKYSYNNIIFGNNYKGKEISRNNKGTIEDVCDEIVEKMINEDSFENPYCIYGHSMGALIGYLVSHIIHEKKLPIPQKLIISGRKSPSILQQKKLSLLPEEEFWEAIDKFGGTAKELNNYPELKEYFIPILKHDFRLVENYRYSRRSKLNIPIDVFYGSEEAIQEDMLGWQDETTEKVIITQLPGNHFFIFDHVEYFRSYFNNLINQNKC